MDNKVKDCKKCGNALKFMYKIYLHLFLWLMGIMVYCVMRTAGETSILKNISVLFILCALFFGLYYISYFMKNRKKEYSINSEGVLGGRGFGILLNFFIVEIVLESFDFLQKMKKSCMMKDRKNSHGK